MNNKDTWNLYVDMCDLERCIEQEKRTIDDLLVMVEDMRKKLETIVQWDAADTDEDNNKQQ